MKSKCHRGEDWSIEATCMDRKKATVRSGICSGVLVLVMIAALPHQTFAQLINLSTRGFVGTADNVMIVGFIIGGSSSRTVVIRGRGPSLSGAPFLIAGTLPNPFLRVFSGQSLIAQNDNWQDTQQQEILLTHLDPCEPNPGQANSPPGCTQESAVLVTLPPGAYTAILSGIGGELVWV